MNTKVLEEICDKMEKTPEEKLQEQKDIYEALEKMTRKQRRAVTKNMPRFSDVIKKYTRINNLKEKAIKQGLDISDVRK